MANSLSIRKGTTKTLTFRVKNSSGENRSWADLGTILVRISQDDGNILDKKASVDSVDQTALKVSYTQEETNRLSVGSNGYGRFKLQLFSIIGPSDNEIAAKTDIYYGVVLPSLWSEVVHND